MPGHGDKSKQKEQLLAALLVHKTIIDAATAVGIAKNTALRWLAEPAFQAAYSDARRQVIADTMSYLQRSMLKAVSALNAVLDDPASKPMVKVVASRALLEFGLRT